MKEHLGSAIAGAIATACLTAALWSIPHVIPDNYRHANGIAPSAAAYLPVIETPSRRLREDIEHRFAFAPDVVHAMAIGVALDPLYPTSRVEELADDLLLPSYKSDIDRALGGKNTATHSSILSVAVKAGRIDIARLILARGGVEAADAQRVAIDAAESLRVRSAEAARQYIEIFAAAGGQPDQVRKPNTDLTLAEILLANAPDLLLLFEQAGFDPWSSLDPARAALGGISLAELAARQGSTLEITGLSVLLSKSRQVPSPEVIENLRKHLTSRAKNPRHIEALLQKLENREGRRLSGQFMPSEF